VRVLLDTHALLWSAIDETQLPRKARSLIESFKTEVYVSAASAWEISTKVRLGKLPEAEAFALEFSANLKRLGFLELAITVDHAQRAGLLPGHHRDPFDRMLMAQSQAENMPLISNEEIFDQYGIQRIW
jgi:PIN domain nuclease of toxin-antitoxin system